MEKIKVASICMPVTSDKVQNLAYAKKMVLKAHSLQAKWVVLPEMFSYMGPPESVWEHAENPESSEILAWLEKTAAELDIVLFAGSIPERCASIQPKVYNTCYVFDSKKGLVGRYRKAHLFNLNTGNPKTSYNESESYAAGSHPLQLDIAGFKVFVAICYDLRFPQFFSRYGKGTDVIVLPSAFTKKTGEAHWHTLIKARSLDLQAYTIASNQVGESYAGKQTYGHSLVCDPWGSILADTKDKHGIAITEISKSAITNTRQKIPVLENTRLDIY